MGRALLPPEGGGSIGLPADKWGDVRTDKINGASIAESGVATTSAAGLMSSADKAKLDGLELAALTITSIESY